MSEEIENLKKQIDACNNYIKNINATVEAHKLMLNDYQAVILQLKTNIILYERAYVESNEKLAIANKEIAELTQPEHKAVEPVCKL